MLTARTSWPRVVRTHGINRVDQSLHVQEHQDGAHLRQLARQAPPPRLLWRRQRQNRGAVRQALTCSDFCSPHHGKRPCTFDQTCVLRLLFTPSQARARGAGVPCWGTRGWCAIHCCSPITEKNFFLTTRGTTWRLLIRLLAQARIKYMMIYELEKPWHWLLGLKICMFLSLCMFLGLTHTLSLALAPSPSPTPSAVTPANLNE